jgi:hypothetical protein
MPSAKQTIGDFTTVHRHQPGPTAIILAPMEILPNAGRFNRRARIVAGSGSADVGPGSVIYVPAHEEHRIVDITQNLAALVIFAPSEYSLAGPAAEPDPGGTT